MQGIEYFPFAAAPQGGYQQTFGSVTCDAVHGNIRGEAFQAVDDQIQVVVPGQNLEFSSQVVGGQVCVPEHVEQLQFDSLYGLAVKIVYGLRVSFLDSDGRPRMV